MDNKIRKADDTDKAAEPGEVARLLLNGKTVLIIARHIDWAARIFKAWSDEIVENAPDNITVTPHSEKLHMAFSNGAVLQVGCVAVYADIEKFRDVRFDHVHAVGYDTIADQGLVARLRSLVVARTN